MSTPASAFPMPGGQMAARPLHFIWLVDCSGSMQTDSKIETLNTAIREAIPHMRDVADNNPTVQMLVRVLKFSNGAEWHVAHPTPIEDFKWVDLNANGVTDMGKALKAVAAELDVNKMPTRAFPPVLVLVSDGDASDDFAGGLKTLMAQPWGKKAVRIAIAIGAQSPEAMDCLQQFMGHPELKPLEARTPEMLVKHIRWASTVVAQSASAPPSAASGAVKGSNVVISQQPPSAPPLPDSGIVW